MTGLDPAATDALLELEASGLQEPPADDEHIGEDTN